MKTEINHKTLAELTQDFLSRGGEITVVPEHRRAIPRSEWKYRIRGEHPDLQVALADNTAPQH